jgi:predicted nucleic acid-binding protein
VISYDTNILIYALERPSQWQEAAQETIIKGEKEGCVLSALVVQEYATGRILKTGEDGLHAFDRFSNLKIVPITDRICRLAIQLTQKYGRCLRGYDAIHIATAIDSKADCFVTNDKTLLNLKVEEIEVKGL